MQDAAAVTAFKEQLGIHGSEEAHFGWIAEVGLQSPLPPRYTSHEDTESGFIYYVDHDRQTSGWENPLVPYLRRVVEIGRAYQQAPTDSFFEEQRGTLWRQHKHDLDCWQGPFTNEEGKQYFVNTGEGISTWQDPRVDAQYIFELESGLLASLEEVLPGLGQRPEDAPWQTSEGAEVLRIEEDAQTFGSPSPLGSSVAARLKTGRCRTPITPGLRTPHTPGFSTAVGLTDVAKQHAKSEAVSTFEQINSAAKRLHELQEDDEEAQRLALAKKIEERKRRRKESQAPRRPQRPPPLPQVQEEAPSAAAARGQRRVPSALLEVQDEADAGGREEAFKPPLVPPSPNSGLVPRSPMADRGARSSGSGTYQGLAFAGLSLGSVSDVPGR